MKRIISLMLSVLMTVSLLSTGVSAAEMGLSQARLTVQEVTEDASGNFHLDPGAPDLDYLEGEVGEKMVICPKVPGVNNADIDLRSGNEDIVRLEKIGGTGYWRVHFKYAGGTSIWFELNQVQYSMDVRTSGYSDRPSVFPYREKDASRDTMMADHYGYGQLDVDADSFYVICTDNGWRINKVVVTTAEHGEDDDLTPAPWTDVKRITDHIYQVELRSLPDEDLYVRTYLERTLQSGEIDRFWRGFGMDIPRLKVEVMEERNGEIIPRPYTGFGMGLNGAAIILPFVNVPSEPVDVHITDSSIATLDKIPGEGYYAVNSSSTPGYTTLTYTEQGRTYYADVFNSQRSEDVNIREVEEYDPGKDILVFGDWCDVLSVNPGETKLFRITERGDDDAGIDGMIGDSDVVDVRDLGDGYYEVRGVAEGKTCLWKVDGETLQICDVFCGNVKMLGIYRYTEKKSGVYEREMSLYNGVGRISGSSMLIRPILPGVNSADIVLTSADPEIAEVERVRGTDDCWVVRFGNPGETKLQYERNGFVYTVDAFSHGDQSPQERWLTAEIMRKDAKGGYFPAGYTDIYFDWYFEDCNPSFRVFQPNTNKTVDVVSSDPSILEISKVSGGRYKLSMKKSGFVTLVGEDEFGNPAYLAVYCGEDITTLKAQAVTSYDSNTGRVECEPGEFYGFCIEVGRREMFRIIDDKNRPVTGLKADPALADVRERGNGVYEITAKANGRTALWKTEDDNLYAFDLYCGNVSELEVHVYNEAGDREPSGYGGIGRMEGSTIIITPYLDGVDSAEIELVSADSSIVSVKRVKGSDGLWELAFLKPGETEIQCKWDGEIYSLYVDTQGGEIWVEDLMEFVPYTGKAITQDFRVYYGGRQLEEGEDYTVSYKNNKDVGDATVTIKFKGAYKDCDPMTFTFHIYGVGMDMMEISYNDELVDLDNGIFLPYTGKAQKLIPALVNPENGVALKAKTDYTITYEGKMTNVDEENFVVLTGKGGYEGEIRIPVHITKVDMSEAVIAPIKAATFTGKPITPKLTVKLGKTTLKQGVHFEAEFSDNVDTGTATVTLTGIGNYEGTCTATFSINGISISKAKMSGFVSSMPYEEGEEAVQRITLTYGGETLKEGEDYTIAYENNDGEGTATMYVNGEGNFHGTQFKKTFKITKVAIKKAKLTGLVASMPYTGEEVTQEGYELVYTVKGADPMVLEEGKDYTVRYEKNVNAGTATIYFDGCGSFTGTLKKTFKITPVLVADNEDIEVEVEDGVFVDSKTAVTPEVFVSFKGEELTLGTDYTVKYSNNKAVASAEDAKAPTVTITFKGNFKGKLTAKFSIEE